MEQTIKLSRYAEYMGVCYATAWKWYKNGKIDNTFVTPTGRIMIRFNENDVGIAKTSKELA